MVARVAAVDRSETGMTATYQQMRPYLRLAISLMMFMRMDDQLGGAAPYDDVMEHARTRADECLADLDKDLEKGAKP